MRTGSVEAGGAWAQGLALSLLAGMSVLAGCMETRRALGEDCLKNDDCFSNVCSQLVCAAPPPTVDRQAVAEAGPADAGLGDAPEEAGDAGAESSTAGNDGSGE